LLQTLVHMVCDQSILNLVQIRRKFEGRISEPVPSSGFGFEANAMFS